MNEIKTRYEILKAELNAGKQESGRKQSEIEALQVRENILLKEKIEAINLVEKLSKAVQNCKCFNISKQQLNNKNDDEGIDLDNCLSDSSLDKNQTNEIVDKNKCEVVTAKIKVNAVKRNSNAQVSKKTGVNKDYSINISHNGELTCPPKQSNTGSLNRMISIETPASKGRYQSVNSYDNNSRDNSKDRENPQESYRSNKTVETNLDEYEINRNTSFNYGNYEVRSEIYKKYDQYYNTNYSRSPKEEKKQQINQYGSNISTYLRAKNESVSKSSLLSHQSLIKINESYAVAEESDLDQSKDLLMVSSKLEPSSRMDKKEKSLGPYETDELEYSKSYCNSNFVFDSNENTEVNMPKSIEIKGKPLINIQEDMNITLGSIDDELNVSKKLNFEIVTTETNEYEDFNGYSEDYTPKWFQEEKKSINQYLIILIDYKRIQL